MHDDYEAENGPKRKLARRMGSSVSKPGGILMLNSWYCRCMASCKETMLML